MRKLAILLLTLSTVLFLAPGYISADSPLTQETIFANSYYCGGEGGNPRVQTSIDIGCAGEGNPIMDMTFAIIKDLTVGVGVVVIASLVWAGIQFSSSRGDPQATASAIKRIRSNVFALLLFFFAYAILNYVVPGAILK